MNLGTDYKCDIPTGSLLTVVSNARSMIFFNKDGFFRVGVGGADESEESDRNNALTFSRNVGDEWPSLLLPRLGDSGIWLNAR